MRRADRRRRLRRLHPVTPAGEPIYVHAKVLLAKTDRLDAKMLATFAERLRPRPAPLRCAARQRLADLVLRRRQLGQLVQAEQHRRRRCSERELRFSLDQHLA